MDLKKAYWTRKYKEEFKSLRELQKVGALEAFSDQQIAYRLNKKSHNTGKDIREKFLKCNK